VIEDPKSHVDLPQPEQMVRDHSAWMLRLAERLMGERALAEDVVQEAFLSAFDKLAEFEARSSIKTWLHRITVNAALMKLRTRKRLAESPIDEHLPEFDGNGCRLEAPHGRMLEVEEVLHNAQQRQMVRDAIHELPEGYRIVLQLRDIEGYDTSEVARFLDISEGNVKVRLHRARSALKHLLEPLLRGEASP
jgi:RNA polymerase sigma-70 factor (ECF subfamily)